uniref:DNA alkylation repair enzyme n=1 Tax=uncultured Nocardioidaceae bacterium TaxID=253824 RepID=A0A6J4KY85_9ACTN|nr:MAG: DNA alkylation repair enzyme [uncultured Nocardioidaceae bacterium]
MSVDTELVATIRSVLRAEADPERAPRMRAYMKSEMPFLGVGVPVVRRLTRHAAKGRLPYVDDLRDTAAALWSEASYREERYAATGLTGLRQALGRLELLDLHREMVVTGAWWDHVDEVSHRVGAVLVAHRQVVTPVMRRWARDRDRWLRRTAILCQLGARGGTDVELLGEVIEVNAADREFFVRKAIGWALRQYARTDPGWVRAYVDAHPSLSPLSRREAIRHLR